MLNNKLLNRFIQFVLLLVCYTYSIGDSIAQTLTENELLGRDSIARKLIFTDAHKALKLAQKNYEYSQNNTVSDLVEAHFMITLGGAYNVSGDYVNSIDITLASILLFEQIDDGAGLIRGYNTLGDIYYHIGEYDKTIRYTKKALEVAESKGFTPFTSNILNNLGGAYRQIKEFEQALEYAQKSVQVATETKQFIVLTYALSTVGEIFCKKQYHLVLNIILPLNYQMHFVITKLGCAIGNKANLKRRCLLLIMPINYVGQMDLPDIRKMLQNFFQKFGCPKIN